MKRIRYACLLQTLHFQLKENEPDHEKAVQLVDQEIAKFKLQLERSNTKYRIDSEEKQADGSVVMVIRRQVMSHDVGTYMD